MIQCVILNASYDPLAVVSAERAITLVIEGKATITERHPTRKFHTVTREFDVPTEIVLKEYRQTGAKYYSKAQLNQRNLFVRDGHTCAYCGRHAFDLSPHEYLTRDHVHPTSQGGQDVWSNVVTACSSCNHKKDDRTPEQAGLVLLYHPKEPTVFEIMRKRQLKAKRRRAA